MTTVTGAVAPTPLHEVGPTSSRTRRLERALRIAARSLAWGLIAAQFVGLLLWSWHLVSRASLTWDFAIYYQPWYQIAHGHLLPRNTFQGGYYFFRNDGELIVYLLAPLYWIFPNHMVGYLWLQDAAIAGSAAVCLRWVTEALPWRDADPLRARAAAGTSWVLVALLLVLNPWTYWVASFDIHMEVFAVFFVLLGLRALLARRRSAFLWCGLALTCGAAASLYVLGAAGAAVAVLAWRARPGRALAVRRDLLRPLVVGIAAVAWLLVLGAAHATEGSPSQGYAYLIRGFPAGGHPSVARVALAVAQHPSTAARVIATHGWNLWANLSPVGLIGLASVPGFFLSAPTLLVNNLLKTQAFSYPSFQNFVVYCSVALGSTLLVGAVLRRRRLWPIGALLALAMVANVAGWFNVWFGQTASRWVLIDPSAAAIVKQVAHEARAQDEVVASQGFLGLLAGRQQVYSLSGPLSVPIRSSTIWFVFSALQGIETASVNQTMEAVAAVQRLPGVAQLVASDGVWVFRWHPGSRRANLELAGPAAAVPAWSAPGPAGTAVLSGPPRSWRVVSNGETGNIIANDYFYEPPGRYVARLSLRSDVPVTLEVWDVATNKMLAGTVVQPSGRRVTAELPFLLAGKPVVTPLTPGSGPFRFSAIPAAQLAPLSIVLWTPAKGNESIWSMSLSPASAR